MSIKEGIKRNKEFMHNARDIHELEVAFCSAKACIAGCNDAGALYFSEWNHELYMINYIYSRLMLNFVRGEEE